MTAQNPDNSRNVIKYTGQNYTFTPAYMRSRDPTTNDIRDPKNQGYYPFTALWINKTNQNLWSLVRIANNLATWILFSTGGSGPMLMFQGGTGTAGTFPVIPDAGGNVTLSSNAGSIVITGSANALNFDLAGGGSAIDQIGVDAFTPPGSNPVIPSGTGQVDIKGGATFATGTLATPIRTNSLLANRLDIESQLSGSNAAVLTANNYGVAQADSNHFTVTNGFWQLKGGGVNPAATSFPTDVGTAVPTAGGVLNIKGQVVPGVSQSGIETTATANEVDIRMFSPFTLTDFSFDTSTTATTRTVQIQNTDNASLTSSARLNVLVGGTSAGDPWSQYTIGTARSWSTGLDNSDSDTYKWTTDADATVDPSSGTFIGAMTTAGGFEFGANASGTSNANVFGSFQKNQNTSSILQVTNATSGTEALGEVRAVSDTCSGSIQAISNSYTLDPNIANYVRLAAVTANGIDFQGLTFRFYGTTSLNIYCTCTSAGVWTYPLQPASAAYLTTSAANQTGNGATVTVPFDTEMYDQATNFAANTFTVPAGADGKYLCHAEVYVSNVTAAMTVFDLDLVAGGVTYRTEIPNSLAANRSIEITRTVNLVAGNTISVSLTISNGAGNTASIVGTDVTGGLRMTYFSVEKVL